MHYVTAGSGPLVVLLHGFPEMWWSWRYQIASLAAAGFCVVAPDLRGYGETESMGPFDIDTLRDDVVGLLDHLGARRAHLVAHDWGAVIAWHLAATRPERCDKLVTLNGPHPALFSRALRRSPRQCLRSAYVLFFWLPWLPEAVLRRGGGRGVVRILRRYAVDHTHFGDDELRPFAEAVCKAGRASAMLGWYRHLRLGRREPGVVPRVDRPVLVVWGIGDPALGFDDLVPGTEAFASSLEIRRIVGAGHFVHEEKPEVVDSLLVDFLTRPA
jgi:pimeloyl-ACP methyl ester carboxylesterase